MTQSIVIILRFNTEDVEAFEAMFEAEVYPLWEEFHAQGKILRAVLAPVEDGSEVQTGVLDYILEVDVPDEAAHDAFDTDPRFRAFLSKAIKMQPREPMVWIGSPAFEI